MSPSYTPDDRIYQMEGPDPILMSSDALVQASLTIFNDQEYADLIVRCDDQVWYCHRNILCKRCFSLKTKITGDGPEWKLTIENENIDAVEQMLRYLYTFEEPNFEPFPLAEWETQRTKIWKDALGVYSIAKKYALQSLGDVAYDVLLRHASRLCRQWDQFEEKTKSERLDLAIDVWRRYAKHNEMPELKAAVLKGLVRIADKLAGYSELDEILRNNISFTIDYVKAVSATKVKKRKRAARGNDREEEA